MNKIISLSSSELDNEDLQILTRQLCKSIADETEIKAEIPSGEVVQGSKGDSVSLAQIAITILGGGGAAALFGIFKAYFDRNSSFSIKITEADGSSFEFNSKNINLEKIEAFLSKSNKNKD